MEETVIAYRNWKACRKAQRDLEEMLESETSSEMIELTKEELEAEKEKEPTLEEAVLLALIPEEPDDQRNLYVEIRAGAGGDEAALFAGDLFRMYGRYAEQKRWSLSVTSLSESALGGIKEIVFKIDGPGAYGRLKFESGVHRVQRVPTTESGGRIHTSTVTVAVLKEADEVEIEIDPNDLRIDVYRSSGHGGQSVNTTDSAVRVTHIPTGMVVTCQQEKSQLKNRDQAIRELRARLLEIEKQKQHSAISKDRKSQVGTGDRSEKIRTYNFPQSRVTDHRIGYTTHRIYEILNGDLDEIIDQLIKQEREEKMSRLGLV
jgi:peptide chain release factor 1